MEFEDIDMDMATLKRENIFVGIAYIISSYYTSLFIYSNTRAIQTVGLHRLVGFVSFCNNNSTYPVDFVPIDNNMMLCFSSPRVY